jgi:hypothetical protein
MQNTIVLKTQDNWEEWNTQFEGLARGKNIWDIITGDKEELPEPEEPREDDLPPAGSTRSQSAVSTSVADQQFAWTRYKTRLDIYTRQQTELNKLREWMQKTISPQVYKHCCKPAETMQDWYINLQQSVGIDNATTKNIAREAYRKAIKPLTKPRDALNWITSWEEAMQKATDAKIAVAASTSDWIGDFLAAVRPINPTWATSYQMIKQKEIDKDRLTFRLAAQDFRKGLNANLINQSNKIAKGSFGPTFNAEEAEEAEGPEQNLAPGSQRQTQKRKRNDSLGNRRMVKQAKSLGNQEVKQTNQACKACGQRHEWKYCFYLFPSKAPKGFKERTATRRYVDLLLETDKEFAKEVEEWEEQSNQE